MDLKAYIEPPKRIPLLIKIGILISRRATKKDLLAPKLLAWYPKAAFSSGILEALVAHGKKDLDKRILKLVRIQASITTACPFCVDMNGFDYQRAGITDEEMAVLVNRTDLDNVETFSEKEKLTLRYATLISQTPLNISADFAQTLKAAFTDREIVILATTAAQVNYWARLLRSLGVPPAGFSETCQLPGPSEQ
jgi:AhpD family alkylhydroperoxidase